MHVSLCTYAHIYSVCSYGEHLNVGTQFGLSDQME